MSMDVKERVLRTPVINRVQIRPMPDFTRQPAVPQEQGCAKAARYVAALTRLSIGSVFLWAFADKLFGLGHSTVGAKSWLNGGSPTAGFLKHGAAGPFKSFYTFIGGTPLVDWLFMAGLLGIGVALVAGIGMRFAAVAGGTLLVLMWSAVLPPANHVFMDDHIIYALVLVFLVLTGAGKTLGLGTWWEKQTAVRRFAALR